MNIFALIYTKTDGRKILSSKLPSATTARHQGKLAVENKHRSNVERFEVLLFHSNHLEAAREILKNRGVENWQQF